MRRADRLIKITHFLRQRRRAVTAKQIAEAFEICSRTVYRDIQCLIDAGAPIMGEAGVGYLIDKQYYLPPITFDADELEAIGLGISMVRQWTDSQFADKAYSAFAKIQAVLPASLQGELKQITTYAVRAHLCLGLSAFQLCANASERAAKSTSLIPMKTSKRPLAIYSLWPCSFLILFGCWQAGVKSGKIFVTSV